MSKVFDGSLRVPRLRMFAGPNGSGKSTIKSLLPASLMGIYINPDEIEKQIRDESSLSFAPFGLEVVADEVLSFLGDSPFLQSVKLGAQISRLALSSNRLSFEDVEVNSYFASVIADFVRHKLLRDSRSFTFETVMSSPDKVDFLRKAQAEGFRTYLYFVATQDPLINIARVQSRVLLGGHPVPEAKIEARYSRSLDLLFEAIQSSNRAYIFDNSGSEQVLLAEITEGQEIELKTDALPEWFQKAVLNKIVS